MPALSPFAARLLPAKADVAARELDGKVQAARYVDGERRGVRVPLLDLTTVPEAGVERATQLLHGEAFTVYAEADGFAWGQSETDGYVGYVPSDGLGEPVPEGRRVTALLAHVYPEASIKRRPLAALPFGARVAVAEEARGFARLAEGGFVPLPQLAPVAGDFVAQAGRFLGAPYLWGGRSAAGLDCSALVQLALAAVGVAVPRDSDMQAASVGEAVAPGTALRRGDLVFWNGHVGIVAGTAAGEDLLLHANAHAMSVTRESLAAVIARVAEAGGPVSAIRRGADARANWPVRLWCEPRGS